MIPFLNIHIIVASLYTTYQLRFMPCYSSRPNTPVYWYEMHAWQWKTTFNLPSWGILIYMQSIRHKTPLLRTHESLESVTILISYIRIHCPAGDARIVDTLRSENNSWHFWNDFFKCIFFNENVCFLNIANSYMVHVIHWIESNRDREIFFFFFFETGKSVVITF